MGFLSSPIIAGILGGFVATLAWVFRRVYVTKRTKSAKLPPGPIANMTPFLGYLPFMGDMPHLHLCTLAKKYGDAYTIRFGSYDIVVLNNPSLIKSCFKEPAYSGRPNYLLAMAVTKHGITFATGQEAAEQRRFVLKTLRDLGFGKRYMENLIVEEVKELVQYFKTSPTDEHQLTYLFGLSVINALWSILASRKFSITDEYARKVYQICIEGFIDPPVAGALWFLPTLAKIFPKWSGYESVVQATEELTQLIAKVVDEHKREMESGKKQNAETVDFVDAYLTRIQEEHDPDSSFYGETGHTNLIHVLVDLFTAGSDTLNSSLNFAIKYLCEDPVLQRKVHREIDQILGGRDYVTIDDRKAMPLLDAVITETLRISSIVTNGILHSTQEDTTLVANGVKYDIPKDTIIMPNFYWVHHNPVYWHNPWEFNPQRFLAGGGEAKKNYVMAFSTGKRICLAEQMAQVEFFLFLGGLLANFEFEGVEDRGAKGYKPGVFGGIKPGLVLNVDGLRVRVKSRGQR